MKVRTTENMTQERTLCKPVFQFKFILFVVLLNIIRGVPKTDVIDSNAVRPTRYSSKYNNNNKSFNVIDSSYFGSWYIK